MFYLYPIKLKFPVFSPQQFMEILCEDLSLSFFRIVKMKGKLFSLQNFNLNFFALKI